MTNLYKARFRHFFTLYMGQAKLIKLDIICELTSLVWCNGLLKHAERKGTQHSVGLSSIKYCKIYISLDFDFNYR